MEVQLKTKNKGFTLPDLGFDYHALEPFLDAETLEIHHTKHHAAYLKNFNEAIADTPLEHATPSAIFAHISRYSNTIRNNGGGFFNHALFWQILIPGGADLPEGELARRIRLDFGTLATLKKTFSDAAKRQFGSGWVWLLKGKEGKLTVSTTANQDNPLMDVATVRGTPVLCLDLWEHAYYLKYQNRKEAYVQAFWNVVNWPKVQELFLRKEF